MWLDDVRRPLNRQRRPVRPRATPANRLSGDLIVNDFVEKRESPRIDVQWPLTILSEAKRIKGETRNIGIDGIAICCDEPLPINEIFRISIQPPNNQASEVSGKIIWSDVYGIGEKDQTYGIGICFAEISEQYRRRYDEMLAVLLPPL